MSIGVLIVEDEPEFLNRFAQAVRSDANLHLLGAVASGAEAIALLNDMAPDVMLIDLGLPDIDGYEVARRLRARTGGGSEPILIALTGHGGAEVTERTRQAGFDHHEVKPVRIDHLLDLISAAAPV